MKKIKLLVSTVLFSSALLLSPTAALAFSIEVVGNGSESENTAEVEVKQTTQILQSNNADVDNSVKAETNTGSNEVEDTTGGEVSIDTGDATTLLALSNAANVNKAHLACCQEVNVSFEVKGNGADSDNKIEFFIDNVLAIEDVKWLSINNTLWLDALTGDNKIDGTTGGDSSIKTGDAFVGVNVENKGNFNEIIIGAMLPEVPVTPTQPGLPKPGAVLAAVTLPMTGFNLISFALIALGMVSTGVILRKNSSELERLLSAVVPGITRAG